MARNELYFQRESDCRKDIIFETQWDEVKIIGKINGIPNSMVFQIQQYITEAHWIHL